MEWFGNWAQSTRLMIFYIVEQFESPDGILIVNQWVKVPAKGRKLKDSEGDILVKRKYVHLVHAL